MDILHLVDRLEEIMNQAHSIPFTHSSVVDEEKILNLIDQMRVAIPDEMKRAQKVLAERDRIMAQAREEAERTVAIGKEKHDQMTERDSIAQAARNQAEQIVAQAHIDAERIRRDADDYALERLTQLEIELDRTLTQVRNGIRTLQTEKTEKETKAQVSLS
jgi:cell division septum initiation protein DivIVA